MSEKKHARISNIEKMEKEISEEREELKENRKSRAKGKSHNGFKKFLIVCFLLGTICCYVGLFVVYGPNTKFRDWFITTAESSMRHQYYARWFYDEETIKFVMSQNSVIETGASTDTSLYNIDQAALATGKVTYKNEYERQILERDPAHLDYKIIEFKDEPLASRKSI